MEGLYGVNHIIFLAGFVLLLTVTVLVICFALKTQKQKDVFVRILGALLAISLVINRISLALWNAQKIGWLELIPNTYCGMTSLLLGLFALFGKPHHKAFDFLFYVELFGGVACLVYSNFLLQGPKPHPTFWFFPTFTGMLHHALGVILCVSLVLCKWFSPSLKRWYIFPIGMGVYTLFGLFLLDVLHIRHTMQIDDPLLPHTPLKWWLVIPIATAIETLVSFVTERIVAAVQRKRTQE